MTPEQEDRAQDLFDEALEKPAAERATFVSASASEDPEVRDRVMQLLRREEEIGDFLGTLAVFKDRPKSGSSISKRSFADGQIVAGRYQILRLIKAGGMGEVYEAFDSTLNVHVALKTILPEIAGSGASADRFRREVALARNVTHRNVCRVYDFGEHRGDDGVSVSFLTMEYLPGETLRERIKRCGKMRPDEALPIIRQMAEGLCAAHGAGVIHRDFKPGNVMLVRSGDGPERVVVSDFGLARSIDAEGGGRTLTEPGQIVGTPEYMAPEQWTGSGVGPATDVYALGVVINDIIRAPDPSTPPGQRSADDRRWHTVVNWCLSRDPADRPSTPSEVVRALEGQIELEGATVRPQRRFEPKWLWVAALIFAVALPFVFSRYLGKQQAPEIRSRRIAVLPFHVDNPDFRMFGDGLTDAITSRLAQYRTPDDTLFIVPASEIRKEQVSAASVARAKFGVLYAIEASLQTEGDKVRLTLSVIDAEALRQQESASVEGFRSNALALQDAAVARIASMMNLDVQPKHASELNRISPLDPGAYEFYLQAKGYLKRNDRLVDVESAIAVARKAVDLDPKYAPARTALAEAYWYKHERTGARSWAAEALRECREALRLNPGSAEAHMVIATVHTGTGQYPEAVQEFQQALTIDPRMIDAHLGLGRVHVLAKEPDKAEASYRKAIELHRGDWRGYKELGLLYYRRSDYAKAIEQYEKVIALTPDNAAAYSNLGAFYGLMKNPKKSEEMLSKALDLEPRRIDALGNLNKLLFDQERYADAAARWEQAVKMDPSSFRLHGNLGAAYKKLGRFAESIASYEAAVKLLNEAIGVNPNLGELYSYRAHYLAPLGRTKEALADLEKSGSHKGKEIEMLVRDAHTLADLGQTGHARELLRKALDLGYPREAALRNEKLRELLKD